MLPAEFSSLHGTLAPFYKGMLDAVEGRIKAELQDFDVLSIVSRPKSAESAFQKLQSGRYLSYRDLEDIAAITVVSRKRSSIGSIMDAIEGSQLQVVRNERRREVSPTNFSYHEPKLILAPPATYVERHPETEGLVVEVQFTTALQHALDVATHDFDYKGVDYSWSKFRLVAQLRGMLELVDGMIDNIDVAATPSSGFVKPPQKFETAAEVLAVLARYFDGDFPGDIRRLLDTCMQWLAAVGWSASDLDRELGESVDVVHRRSLSVCDRVLAVICKTAVPGLLSGTELRFVVSRELLEASPECAKIPADRRVDLSQ